ncbi:MAG: LysM peptidoglycan-binding domain-containing protein [Desulfobacterales bacterium]|nr:LysM peptidoglycan-binding domain-containing protein [Desulfobacterales bacterium]
MGTYYIKYIDQELQNFKQNFGLSSDKDERRNIFKSTDAAIDYLKELHEIFGSWTLAAAAYNMGEHGLRAEIMVQNNKDFYDLYLPLETQQYIFRIVSAKLIMTQPQRYGFNFSEEDLYHPLSYEEIEIKCFGETPIAVISEAANTSLKVIKDLNPQLRGYYLSAGKHLIHVPKGSGKGFHARFKSLIKNWKANQKDRIYVVKQGDNLSSIAKRFNIPLPALILWNDLDYTESIHPGDRLIIRPHKECLESAPFSDIP